MEGLKALGLLEKDSPPLRICHGSTIATNALLEGKGARTAFITNEGFEDLLVLGRQARESLYNLTPPPAQRVFPDTECFGVAVRCEANGRLLQPLTRKAIEDLVHRLKRYRPQAVAVNLLFSYLRPNEEKELLSYLDDDLFVTLSSDLLPRHGEYERGLATWLNAWLGPLVQGYLNRLQRLLPEVECSVMQSSGLTTKAKDAARRAVHLLLSGPAGGVASASYIAAKHAEPRLLTFDMGGTSTDVSLVMGTASLTDQSKIGPYLVAIPMIDIQTIGAGGGSIATVDEAGMLIVGPDSAGARPGPACYALGGAQATVTDAHLHLGYLLPEHFLGGRMKLDPTLAEQALEVLGQPLGMTSTQVAEGILQIVNERMVQALRMITLERGHDPAAFTLCCFGGAGGLHLCALADSLGITRALVPEHSGVLSAFGMIAAPAGRELIQDIQRPLEECSNTHVHAQFQRLEAQGRQDFANASVEDFQIERWVGLRYYGQLYAIQVPWSDLRQAEQDFVAQHLDRYGFRLDKAIELVFLRLSIREVAEQLEYSMDMADAAAMKTDTFSATGFGQTQVFERCRIPVGETLKGPAILVEDIATTLVPPSWRLTKRADGLLELVNSEAGPAT